MRVRYLIRDCFSHSRIREEDDATVGLEGHPLSVRSPEAVSVADPEGHHSFHSASLANLRRAGDCAETSNVGRFEALTWIGIDTMDRWRQ